MLFRSVVDICFHQRMYRPTVVVIYQWESQVRGRKPSRSSRIHGNPARQDNCMTSVLSMSDRVKIPNPRYHRHKRQLLNTLHLNPNSMTRHAEAMRLSQTSTARRSHKNHLHLNPTKTRTMTTHQLHVYLHVDVLPSASNQDQKIQLRSRKVDCSSATHPTNHTQKSVTHF